MIKRIVLVVLGVVLHTAATAQRRDSVLLNEFTVQATRLFEKEAAGGKETHVDTTVLAVNVNHTLSELLSENTHVFIKSYGRGSLATASFRGTAPSHTQVVWNGMPVNSPMLGMVDFSLIPVYFIDDLTLKHGGASIEESSGALGGNVLLQNKPDWNNELSGRFIQGFGSFTTVEDFLQVNMGNKKIQSKSRAYYTYSKNDFPFYNDAIIGKPRWRNKDGAYTLYSIMQELYGRIDESNRLSLRVWTHVADRSIPRLNSNESGEDTNINTQLDKTWRINSEWRHNGKRSTLVTMAGVNLQDLDYSLVNQVIGLGPQSAIYSVSRSGSYINRVEFQYDLSPKSTISVNANYNYHDVNTRDTVKRTGYKKDRHEISAYAAYQRNFFDRLNIKLAVRQDYIDHNAIPLIPYAGFDFRVWTDRNIFIKANITRNYHVPTLNDLYWQPGGNASLRPEDGLSEEIGVAWLTNVRAITLETQMTGYYADITDWIIWIPSFRGGGYWEPRNVENVISKGIELTAKIKYDRYPWQITANGNFAWTPSRNYGDKRIWGDESRGKQLVYIPLHSGNLFVNVKYKKSAITWQFNSYDKRYTTSSNDVTTVGSLPDYYMNQVYLAQEFIVKRATLEIQLKVYNLFNEYYRSVLARRMPERNYMLLLTCKF